jgi:type VI secretion system secreted protein VgrG
MTASRVGPVVFTLLMLLTFLVQPIAAVSPPTVPLGTAAPFALLAGSAITNVPTSTIGGDVGLSPDTGAGITGLTCAEVSGTIYTVDLGAPPACREQDAGLLTTAKNALTNAYDNAAGRTPDTTYVVADNQLGGEVLVAGVYRFGGASTANLIGNLELSGSADDIWIFQATSTLVTAASSSITFSGGAQACNVFWQIGSAATLGASSSFAGTILAHDTISVGNGVTVNGRLLAGAQASHAGAITLIMDTIIRSDCAAAPAPTPTAAPVATPTAAPAATPTAAPVATPTAAPGATPTAAPVVPTSGPGATVGPSATATPASGLPTFGPAGTASPTGPVGTMTNTSSLPGDTPLAAEPVAIFLAVMLGLGALVLVATRAPSRPRE